VIRSIAFGASLLGILFYWDLQMKLRALWRYQCARDYADRYIHHMAHSLFNLARVYLGLRIVIERTPEITLPDHFVVVVNHQSLIDIVAVKLALPEHPVRFVAKKELGKWFPAVSMVLRLQRHALIDRRSNRDETMRQLDGLARRSRAGSCPVIFAEGTRSRSGQVLPFQVGAIRRILSINPLSVVALAVDGGYQASHLLHLSARGRNVVFRTKILQVFPADASKSGVSRTVKAAEAAIRNQLDVWHRG